MRARDLLGPAELCSAWTGESPSPHECRGLRYKLRKWRLVAAIVLDGNKIAGEIRTEVASEVKTMTAAGMRPGLAVILVGHNPASEVYIRGKVKSSGEVGLYSEQHTPLDAVSTEELLELIADLNRRDEIDGILVQLPLPPQVDAKKILMAVDPAKDVDGFPPMNEGFLSH